MIPSLRTAILCLSTLNFSLKSGRFWIDDWQWRFDKSTWRCHIDRKFGSNCHGIQTDSWKKVFIYGKKFTLFFETTESNGAPKNWSKDFLPKAIHLIEKNPTTLQTLFSPDQHMEICLQRFNEDGVTRLVHNAETVLICLSCSSFYVVNIKKIPLMKIEWRLQTFQFSRFINVTGIFLK